VIVDLFPGAYQFRWEHLERAVEYIESTTRPFTQPEIHEAIGRCPRGSGAARDAVRSLLAVGLITRVSPAGASPVFYLRGRLGGAA